MKVTLINDWRCWHDVITSAARVINIYLILQENVIVIPLWKCATYSCTFRKKKLIFLYIVKSFIFLHMYSDWNYDLVLFVSKLFRLFNSWKINWIRQIKWILSYIEFTFRVNVILRDMIFVYTHTHIYTYIYTR